MTVMKFLRIFRRKFINSDDEDLSFESFTKYSFFLFRLLFFNFDPLKAGASAKEKFTYIMRISYYVFCLIALACAVSSMIAYTVVHSDSLEIALKSFPNVLFDVLIGLKAFAIFLRRGDIWKIFHIFKIMQERRAGNNQKYEVKRFLDEYHFHMKAYTTPFVTISLTLILPVFIYVINGTMILPVEYWFPFDIYRSEIFPFVLFLIEWISLNTELFLLSVDSLVYALLISIAMEFHVLRIDFINIKFIAKDERSKYIQELIDRHNKLLNLCDKMQEIFDLVFLITIAISSLIICSILFQLSLVTIDFAVIGFYVSYMIMVGGQTFLLCLYGQKLITASESVADGVYHCGWEQFIDNNFKKQLVLIICRGQKAKRLTAMRFANIFLESYATVRQFSIIRVKIIF